MKVGWEMLFDEPSALLRTLVVGLLSYATLILVLRLTGKRTLSKWNAFDFVVTIAIGSTLATALLSQQTTYAQGAFALILLVLLQYGITWLTVRSAVVRRWIKAEPTLLLRRGELIRDVLKAHRVADGEVLAAVRGWGFASLEDVEAVVLETDGSFSVIGREKAGSGPATALGDVAGYSSD